MIINNALSEIGKQEEVQEEAQQEEEEWEQIKRPNMRQSQIRQ